MQFQGASARSLCITASSGEEEFVLVTSLLAESGTIWLTVENDNTAQVSGPPSPTPGPDPPRLKSNAFDSELPRQDAGIHVRLREIERRELSGRVAATAGSTHPAFRISAQSPGDFMTLNTQSESACMDPHFVTGKVEAVSSRTIVVADTANPADGFGRADFERFAAIFDTLVGPLAEEHFGEPSDIDGNGRVIIFFTKEVNAVGAKGDDSLTAGFFFSRDLFPVVSPGPPLGGCPASNEAELLYLIVPDPSGVAGNRIDRDEAESLIIVTMAHEYQHVINASQRLLDAAGPRPFEESWLNESLSHAMEELLFYRVTGLSPRRDLGIEDLEPSAILALNDFQRLNFFRFLEFLKDPGRNSPYDPEVGLPARGAGWNFLRYAADRAGADDALFFRALVDSEASGIDNLATALGGRARLFDWLSDWSIGLYGDNRVPGLAERFADQSWNNFSLFDSAGLPPPYIQTSSLWVNPMVLRQIEAGGSAYFRFAVAPGQLGWISLRSGGGALPSTLRATVLRTK